MGFLIKKSAFHTCTSGILRHFKSNYQSNFAIRKSNFITSTYNKDSKNIGFLLTRNKIPRKSDSC